MNQSLSEQDIAAASDWLTILQSDQFDGKTKQAFGAWVSASESHRLAFDRVEKVWQDLSDMKHTRAGADLRQRANSTWFSRGLAVVSGLFDFGAWQARPILNMGVMALATAWLAVGINLWPKNEWQVITTGSGERQSLTLADGSVLRVGPKTELQYRLGTERRQVELLHGQVFFDIKTDAQRPFFVVLGKAKITVVGTRFDVLRSSKGSKVVVQEGSVSLQAETPGIGEQEALLASGDAITYLKIDGMSEVEQVDPKHIATWLDGRLTYTNVPLVDFVEDVNRYHHQQLVLMGADFSHLNVSATFSTDQFDTVVNILSKSLPLRIEPIDEQYIAVYLANTLD